MDIPSAIVDPSPSPSPDVLSIASTLSSTTTESMNEPKLIEHPSLYFPDGNIILIAENVKFRVYGGHLTCQSNVFKDMMSIGRPEGSEMVDGCPAVYLDDSAELLGHLLEIMLHGVRALRSSEYPEWPQVKALLELGSKYDIPDAFSEGMEHIRAWLPDKIEEWDESPLVDYHRNDPEGCFQFIDIANTCRKLNLDDVRVRALYLCCCMPTSYIINGCASPSGSNLGNEGEGETTSVSEDTTLRTSPTTVRLHPDDILTCLDSRSRLSSACVRWMVVFSAQIPPNKDDPAHDWRDCKDGQKTLRKDVLADSKNLVSFDPLLGLNDSYWDDVGLCDKCIRHYQGIIDKERQKVLDKLSTLILLA